MMTDQQIADRIGKWWRTHHEGVPPSKVERMVRKWILMTRWGREMDALERIKLQARVSRLMRSRNAVKAARTRKRKRSEALRPKQAEFDL